ncbi:MAG: apolipoprotein N-acyltransferase [Bryobacteraceae bacterium]
MLLSLALAILSALLLIVSFPRLDLYLLAPLALAPLLVATARERRPGCRFLCGWAAGVVYWAGACYWIQSVLAVHGAVPPAASWAMLALFSVAKALHLAVFGLLAGLLIHRPCAILSLPALWVALESTHGSLGFAWLALGNAGIDMDAPLRLAPFTGVWGLSFVFAMTASALALLVLRRPPRQFVPLLFLPLLYLLPQLPPPQPGTETAVLVQPNISESAEWTPDFVADVHRRLASLSLHTAPGAKLVLWPEIPAPIYYYESALERQAIGNLARQANAYLLLNVVPHDPQGFPLNSALLISPDGQPTGRYDKMNLVPFGEFVPGPFKPLVDKVSSQAGDFAPGRNQLLLPAGPHRLGVFICYESVFPNFVRQFAAQGAGLLVNISNDGWYGDSAARYQHLKIVRMRAAENRRWLLRATNDGLTSVIDPAGRLNQLLPPYLAAAAPANFSYISSLTFYTSHGDWFPWLCALAALAALARKPAALAARPNPPRNL